MPSFSDVNRGLDGLDVPHFSDENNIGVLPEDVLERLSERGGV